MLLGHLHNETTGVTVPSFTPRPHRAATLVLALTFGVAALAACGDDEATSAEGTTTTAAAGSPEEHKAPMEEVLAGLSTIQQAGEAAATAAEDGDFETALAEYEELHEVWEEVEGTIKDTDPDAYEAIETANGLIKDGAENENADRVRQGADDLAAEIDAFVEANG
jgi:ABC-type glycerol-3-phosphate transport system substrate-binding protein